MSPPRNRSDRASEFYEPRILDCGDSALSVDFGNFIDPQVNARVMALDAALSARSIPGVVEAVPSYRALMVHVDPCRVDFDELRHTLLELASSSGQVGLRRQRWVVPVVYGGAFGEDLEVLATRHGLSNTQLIDLHSAPVYRVYMVGFMPGFSYLGGMDARLRTPRRTQPRPSAPASSISIGGSQSAIGSLPAPSGWHLIGRTPVRPFMPSRTPQFLFQPGDEIVFDPIAERRWNALDAAAAAGETVAQPAS